MLWIFAGKTLLWVFGKFTINLSSAKQATEELKDNLWKDISLQVLEVVDKIGDLLNVKYFPYKKSGRAVLYNKESFDNEASFEEKSSEPEA